MKTIEIKKKYVYHNIKPNKKLEICLVKHEYYITWDPLGYLVAYSIYIKLIQII